MLDQIMVDEENRSTLREIEMESFSVGSTLLILFIFNGQTQ